MQTKQVFVFNFFNVFANSKEINVESVGTLRPHESTRHRPAKLQFEDFCAASCFQKWR